MSPGSYDSGGHRKRGAPAGWAGAFLLCTDLVRVPGTRQRMRILQRKERKMQGSG